MIELALLVLAQRLINWGYPPIFARRTVAADACVLNGFLANPENQWCLAGSFADIVALTPVATRCEAELRLACGVRCHASAHVQPRRSARVLATELRLGRRIQIRLTWILTPARGTTEVDLAAQMQSRNLATRICLLLGGRRWIAARLSSTLALLATIAAYVAEDRVDDLKRPQAGRPAPAAVVERTEPAGADPG